MNNESKLWVFAILSGLTPLSVLLSGIIITEYGNPEWVYKSAISVVKVLGGIASLLAVFIGYKALDRWKIELEIKNSQEAKRAVLPEIWDAFKEYESIFYKHYYDAEYLIGSLEEYNKNNNIFLRKISNFDSEFKKRFYELDFRRKASSNLARKELIDKIEEVTKQISNDIRHTKYAIEDINFIILNIDKNKKNEISDDEIQKIKDHLNKVDKTPLLERYESIKDF